MPLFLPLVKSVGPKCPAASDVFEARALIRLVPALGLGLGLGPRNWDTDRGTGSGRHTRVTSGRSVTANNIKIRQTSRAVGECPTAGGE